MFFLVNSIGALHLIINISSTREVIMNIYFILVIVILLILAFWWVFTLNSFVAKLNRVKEAESAIGVMLKQRSSLIPNIVATVQKYVVHESDTLQQITKMRSSSNPDSAGLEDSGLDLKSIKILVEQYPDLKADKQFIRLIDSLEEMELQIQASRRSYNSAVVSFNNYVQMFPSSLVASSKHYKVLELIVIDEVDKRDIELKSLFNS